MAVRRPPDPPSPPPRDPATRRTERRAAKAEKRQARAVPRRAGCFGWFARFGLIGAVILAGVLLVGAVTTLVLYRYYIVDNPGPQFDRDAMRKIISQESPVYYRDGVTPVGVFFESEHRVYVPYEELPEAWVVSIVAAEDATFWTHPGFSAKHIVRAIRDDILAGSVVAGGSTLTQQTAKNLFYRPDRSMRSKGMELVNALRLEAHFSKSEILTFYANQFHVTGNGRGFGIGARHFFDKEPEDLTLVECAFLAGLVKAPAYYDPFLGDEAKRQEAIARATDRTRYVLGQIAEKDAAMLAGPMPVAGDAKSAAAYQARVKQVQAYQAEARKLLKDGFQIPFRRGNFRYESSAVLDEVARRLAAPPFDRILGEKGLDPASGLVVITTLDVDAEREATWGLWHHLTEVGTWLEARTAADFAQAGVKPPRFDPDFPPAKHEFRYAVVKEVSEANGKRQLGLDLGGTACTVDRDGVTRAAVAIYRGEKKSSSAKAPSSAVEGLIDALPVGTVVWVSVRETPAEGPALCDLELRPELQGAAVVLDHGQIRAMVGGNDNRNFNRATALRQFGSTWKPLVYHSALQLGWSPADLLDNRRNVFSFSGTSYWPSPDHAPADRVSMAWAGVNSENLASVWLLYHLTDRLDGEEVRKLARSLDLAPRSGEAGPAYQTRIQKAGVLPTPARVEEAVYLHARAEVLSGVRDATHPEDELALLTMPYGWGFDAERGRVGGDPVKLAALDNSWQHLADRLTSCELQYHALQSTLDRGVAPTPAEYPDLKARPPAAGAGPAEVACGTAIGDWLPIDAWIIGDAPLDAEPDEEVEPEPEPAPDPEPQRGGGLFGHRNDPKPDRPRPERPDRPDRPRRSPRISGPRLVPLDDVLVDGRLSFGTADAVRRAMDRQRQVWDIGGRPDLYDPEILYWLQDFRVLLGLKYVAALAEEYGVVSDVAPVMSLPLGASEITLEEAATLYGGLVSGVAWDFPGSAARVGTTAAPVDPALLIAEIRDVDGNVLYRARPTAKTVAPAATGALTADILRNVVRWGTGRRASDAIREAGNPIPVGGKTGTTNDYKNVAFLGYAPLATPAGYDAANGLVVGVYVGYDDNHPLTNGGIKLAGASGALPAWIATVQGLEAAGLLGKDLPALPTEGGAWPLLTPGGLTRVAAAPETGIPAPGADIDPAAPSILVAAPAAPEVEFHRFERPARVAPGTEAVEPPDRPRRRDRRDGDETTPAPEEEQAPER